ncbi:MAG: DUF4915 domain-containing protein [Chloroflexi bacterium]|nr:DUF4915 domain-containing protein [Chloroflexota bacterium]
MLLKIDRSLSVRHAWRLEETRDAHSLVPFEGGLLVNDTFGNRIMWIEMPSDGQAPREVEYWRYCDAQVDAAHVNCVSHLNGQVFVSMFGEKPEDGWAHARGGKIVNITTNEAIAEGVFHPHSLIRVGEALYWLESNGGRIHRFSDRAGHEIVGELEGYLRGMAHDGEYLYIAASAVRRRSKSTGNTNKLGPVTPSELNSWIYRTRLDSLGREAEKRRLTSLGAEIYDLLLLGNDTCVGADEEEIDPVVQRVWRVEDQYINAVSELEQLAGIRADRDRALEQLAEMRADRDRGLEQISEKARQIEQLQESRERALAQISHQEARLREQAHQNEHLRKELQLVSRDLTALRRTRTVRVSRALGALAKRALRRTEVPA